MTFMSDSKDNIGNGILKGLKRVLFQHDHVTEDKGLIEQQSPAVGVKASPVAKIEPYFSEEGTKDMKLKVYQLLENLNKPGIDFFEVWNAAVEMGGANTNNIKAAYTSLKFADKTLDKARLLETGSGYVTALSSVIETETKKRMDEKLKLDKEKEQARSNLSNEITTIEQQISSLQEKLSTKKMELENLHAKYEPVISAIDVKIKSGQQSVSAVLQEMQQVLELINKDLN